jgi:hypothetical protein
MGQSPPTHPFRLRNLVANSSLATETVTKLESSSYRPVVRALALGPISKSVCAPRGEGIGAVRQMKLGDQVAGSRAHEPPTPTTKWLRRRFERDRNPSHASRRCRRASSCNTGARGRSRLPCEPHTDRSHPFPRPNPRPNDRTAQVLAGPEEPLPNELIEVERQTTLDSGAAAISTLLEPPICLASRFQIFLNSVANPLFSMRRLSRPRGPKKVWFCHHQRKTP